jgi:hypothetical protein
VSDLQKLLDVAADDTDRPLRHSVDDIVRRGRRSVRNRRIATAAGVALTTTAIVGGFVAWSTGAPREAEPAGRADAVATATIDVVTGKPLAPVPPVSPMSDSAIIERCMVYDKMPTWNPQPWNVPGTLTTKWHVAVKSGGPQTLSAVLVSPDRTVGATCNLDDADPNGPSGSYGRFQIKPANREGVVFRSGYGDGLRVPRSVTKVLVDVPDEDRVRQALVGTDGFYTLGAPISRRGGKATRIRGYDANGRKVLDQQIPFVVGLPPMPTS